MAKADLKNLEQAEIEMRRLVGSAVLKALRDARKTQKEFAGLLDRDEAQVARWIAGAENVNIAAILSRRELAGPMVLALAELVEGIEVTTTISLRRLA